MKYDVFINHASEDKGDVARPLAAHLEHLGLKVWLDEFELTLGDSLRRSIDRGLSQSKYSAVILSPAFFEKEWPNKELDGLVAREDGRHKVILPIWHNVGADEIVKYSPILADKLAISTSRGIAQVAKSIFEAVTREAHEEDGTVKIKLVPSESEILERLRKQMLIAKTAWELKKVLYELEEYIAKYPHSPDARLLKDKIEIGKRLTEMKHQATETDIDASEDLIGRWLYWGCYIWPILFVGAIVFLSYLLFRIFS